jgi:hypothetical protein
LKLFQTLIFLMLIFHISYFFSSKRYQNVATKTTIFDVSVELLSLA